ncbi:hypothetical protein KSF78_0004624, partial [Schistosoma japonicum]
KVILINSHSSSANQGHYSYKADPSNSKHLSRILPQFHHETVVILCMWTVTLLSSQKCGPVLLYAFDYQLSSHNDEVVFIPHKICTYPQRYPGQRPIGCQRNTRYERVG